MKISTDDTRRTVGLTLALLFSVNAGGLPVQLGQPAERSTVAPLGFSRTHGKQFSEKSGVDNSRRVSSSPSPENDLTARARMSKAYGELPLTFEAHEGHAGNGIKFTARTRGYDLFLTPNEAVLALRRDDGGRMKKRKKASPESLNHHIASLERAVLRVKLAGANPRPRVSGAEELPGKVNYFIGNDPAKWRAGVATYAKVRYESVYPGVDMVYYGNRQQLEYDFVLAPGANYRNIKLAFEGVRSIKIDARGDLVLRLADGLEVRQQKPLAYQEVGGERREISSRYVLKGRHHVGFRLGKYDRTKPLVIDPVLVYSTFLGGSGGDVGDSIAVDSSGNAYVTGSTGSSNFPVANALQSAFGFGDVFVTKLNAAGTALVYSTYLGGTGDEQGHGITVDPSGNVYLVGETGSQDDPFTSQNEGFPTVNAVRPNRGLGRKAFATKLNPAGSALVYSTYLGGDGGTDIGTAIAADAAGNAYVTGLTNATNFPTANAFQPAIASPLTDCAGFPCGITNDAFVVKFSPTGSFVYSTYFGSSEDDWGLGIAADSAGNAYVTGTGRPPTTPGSFQTSGPGVIPGFIAKFNENGSALIYSTRGIWGNALAVDTSGNAYVTGSTFSTGFPPTTNGAFDRQCGTDGNCNPSSENVARSDAYVTKLNAAGTALIYSTYLGGSDDDRGHGIAVDASGNAYVTGSTGSADFPLLNSTQAYSGGDCGNFGRFVPCFDAFVTKLNAAGSALVYSTLLGGDRQDFGGNQSSRGSNGIAVDGSGNAYVTGLAGSANFPKTPGAFQTAIGGGDCGPAGACGDAFVAKIADPPPNPIDNTDPFVRQHYADFLNRTPDAAGLDFWTNNINSCGTDASCREVKRIDTSAAFFLSIEFQGTGYLVFRFYKASFPVTAQRPRALPRMSELLSDTQQVGQGVIVGQGNWEAQLEANKVAYANQFVGRAEFTTLYPSTMSAAQFVDALNQNTGGSLSQSERDALVDGLTSGAETRATALRRVAENGEFLRREFNAAFVLMQYIGYLRRNPDDAPDGNFDGYDFWLAKLNQFAGDFRQAEMVKAFITSGEYRQRFGPQ